MSAHEINLQSLTKQVNRIAYIEIIQFSNMVVQPVSAVRIKWILVRNLFPFIEHLAHMQACMQGYHSVVRKSLLDRLLLQTVIYLALNHIN